MIISVLYNFDNKNNTAYNEYINITKNKLQEISDKIYIVSNQELNDSILIKTSNEFLDFLKNSGKDNLIILTNAYTPLIDIQETKKMIEEHNKWAFDYTYYENLPDGLLPELLSTNIVDFIIKYLPENFPLFRKSIRELFEKDISSYDTNIYLINSNLAYKRINFIPYTHNDYLFIDKLIKSYGTNPGIKGIEKILEDNPELLYNKPTYFEIELTTDGEKNENFPSFYLERKGSMETENFKKIIDIISNTVKECYISIGLYGEIFLYKDLDKVIDIIKDYKSIKFIFESRSIHINKSLAEKILSLDNTFLIFDISHSKSDKFEMDKKDKTNVIPFIGLDKTEELIKLLPNKEKIYIQFTRNKENEDELLRFYEKWKDYSDRIIIKKIDTIAGKLKHKLSVDLSPVERFPCYHLKNDLVILYNGDIPLCRQDINCNYKLGNIFNDNIETILENKKKFYLDHSKLNYNELCKDCDEWWIFNF